MGVEFGEKIRISLFGESHGAEIGAMISGMPRGEMFDSEILAAFMKRRAPSADATSTARREADKVFCRRDRTEWVVMHDGRRQDRGCYKKQ